MGKIHTFDDPQVTELLVLIAYNGIIIFDGRCTGWLGAMTALEKRGQGYAVKAGGAISW